MHHKGYKLLVRGCIVQLIVSNCSILIAFSMWSFLGLRGLWGFGAWCFFIASSLLVGTCKPITPIPKVVGHSLTEILLDISFGEIACWHVCKMLEHENCLERSKMPSSNVVIWTTMILGVLIKHFPTIPKEHPNSPFYDK